MHILAIVPARGGSKGILLKNIKKIARKPLIEYTITAAKKSKYLDKIVVSTDNKRIAKIAKETGAEVPFLRPKKISRDNTPVIDVIKHTLNFVKNNQSYIPDIILLLQPTSPLRTTEMIDRSILLLSQSKATSVLGVKKIKTHPYGAFWFDKEYLRPFRSDFERYSGRQGYPSLYYPTGSIYTFWNKTLQKYDSIYGPKIKPMIVDDQFNIDIDDPFDLFISEMTILHWKRYKDRKK